LGYTPLSYRSSRAKVSFIVTDPVGLPTTLTLPKYSPFITNIDGIEYTFVNLDPVTITPQDGVYLFDNVEIVQGEPLVYSYRVDVSGPGEKYAIPNDNIDTSTLRVTVQNSYTDLTIESYDLAQNLSVTLPTSKVYFLEQNPSGFYEIFFGDGVLGKKLTSGNIVKIEYLTSAGDVTNVSATLDQTFSLGISIGGVTVNTSILAIQNSTGGSPADTLAEIKFKAPRFLSSYNRAVTAEDYKSIIQANYPLVESIAVWGGEENIPPKYGKVIISLKPYNGYTISEAVKTNIRNNILANKKVMSIIPEFVDPNYLYITIDSVVKVQTKNSRYTVPQIEIFVRDTVNRYFTQELQQFNKTFIYSKLSKIIDAVDASVIGNVTSIKVHKRIVPIIGALNGYAGDSAIKFSNKLVSGSITSSAFYYTVNNTLYTAFLQDNLTSASTGTIDLLDFYTNSVLVSGIGSVDYTEGKISFASLNPTGYIENVNDIRIYSKIDALDITTTKDVILILDDGKADTASKRLSGFTTTMMPE
jgi:hypothetical protein